MRRSQRSQRISESATLKVKAKAAELAARGVEVVDFGPGEPDFPSPPVAIEAARQALADGFTKYTATPGIPALRKALAARYGRDYGAPWESEDGLVTVGAKGALFELFLALLDPGDEVVVPSPCWVSFPEQIRFTGAEPVMVPLSGADDFAVHAEPLIEAMTDRTRAVLVNSPSNPTGGVISAEEMGRLIEACAERDIVLVSDETYERFLFEGEPLSAARWATSHPETVVVVGSFSKAYSMTGWRLGYLFGPRPLVKAISTIQSHATSNPTSFAMVGAVAALEHGDAYVENMVAEYRRRRDFLVPRLEALPGIRCPSPSGAFYVFPRVAGLYRGEIEGSVDFAADLLDKAHVAVVPGVSFGDDSHVRISFACSTDELERGLERIAQYIDDLSA